MFDRLLRGGTVSELESELEAAREQQEHLEAQLEAEKRRRADAVTDRQAAQEQVNDLEDRIAQLEGTVDRLRDGERELSYRGRRTLDRRATERILDRLQSVDAPPDGALTAVVRDPVPDELRDQFGDRTSLLERAAPCIALADEDRLISVALRPPVLPDSEIRWDATFDVDRSNYLPTGSFAFALVRSDVFALGEYRGEERLSFEGFESDVKGDHSKGGFSQGRFERRRDAQIDEHLDAAADALESRDVETLYLTGDRGALDALDDRVDAKASAAVDASGKPEAALDDAFEDFWQTKLYLI
ncbi:Vms1/Ankzf1 family peptidyl-tRNA hydrolase [Salinarchaeum laminariae]|uniref:Vms1/Ankzf1 family peptidyl-tRNA hydrolase n=1 Tax=Salinarchaeum laminariae TaxID=869888 RepID=UPI0020C14489|nr:Vms1/Ankzf1 family peptidyl-tRNA hydrolase [Salinarchaeum laminariae]